MITLATDFDGTIFFMNETPSFHKKDLEAIQTFQKDNKLGLCSGRPYTSVTQYTDPYFKFDFIISSTGSYIADKEGNVLVDKPIVKDVAVKVVNRYENSHTIFFHIDQIFAPYKLKLEEDNPLMRTIYSLNELDNHKLYQITIVGKDDGDAIEITDYINQNFELNAFRNANMIDIVHTDCSKGKGIQFIKEYYKIDSIIGIGDSHNDLAMFEACDESYTFSYSPLEVQEKATNVVDHFYQAISEMAGK